MELTRNSNFKFYYVCPFFITFNKLIPFTNNASYTITINVFEPHALTPKFKHLIFIYFKNHYFITMNLEFEKKLGDERKAPSKVTLPKNLVGRIFFSIPYF
jgi:hypothetical protein